VTRASLDSPLEIGESRRRATPPRNRIDRRDLARAPFDPAASRSNNDQRDSDNRLTSRIRRDCVVAPSHSRVAIFATRASPRAIYEDASRAARSIDRSLMRARAFPYVPILRKTQRVRERERESESYLLAQLVCYFSLVTRYATCSNCKSRRIVKIASG